MHFQSVARADAAIASHSQARQLNVIDPVPGASQIDRGIVNSITICEPLLFGIGAHTASVVGRGAFGIVFALAGDHGPLGLVIKVAKQKSKFSEVIDGSLGTEAMALRTAEILAAAYRATPQSLAGPADGNPIVHFCMAAPSVTLRAFGASSLVAVSESDEEMWRAVLMTEQADKCHLSCFILGHSFSVCRFASKRLGR
jgi:hypothetical protein